jgi:N-acetylglutamate synthase-like GNAT family acetyltransferase
VSTGTAVPALQRLDRAGVQRHLDTLTEWLLPDSFYRVQHTWPQLYRSDGGGNFLVLLQQGRLVSHCAFREAILFAGQGTLRAALLGSVATDPAERGRGHAGRLLREALDDCRRRDLDVVVLWAERPDLYARAGFAPGPVEHAVVLSRHPCRDDAHVRRAEIRDHCALHELHERKPWRVQRTPAAMSGLLTAPGLSTFVFEDGGRIRAYACCGKGADLQGVWHEVGGDDEHVARLLPAAMAQLEQRTAVCLLPPYRTGLTGILAASVVEALVLAGPMVAWLHPEAARAFWVDGLDSV